MPDTPPDEKLLRELDSFKNLWEDGYFEGDPLDPMCHSSYGVLGYMSTLHVVYLTCIKPYITRNSIVLEIGPGRGGWTRTFLPTKEIWCLDALSAKHNRFWEYVGAAPHVRYFQVSDFSCSMLPENKFDYLFSFGTFCHISFEGITEYMRNLYPKLKTGAHCFIMIADYQKYNSALDNLDNLNIVTAEFDTFARRDIYKLLKWPLTMVLKWVSSHTLKRISRPSINEDNTPRPARWYHAGVERTCNMLREMGYQIIDPDVGAVHRDPIIHFIK